MDSLEMFRESIQAMTKEIDMLSEQLSIMDSKEQDVLHFIEFGKINARDGYKLAKALKDIRKERRQIKNKKSQIQSALSFSISINTTPSKVCEIITKSINNSQTNALKPKTYEMKQVDMISIVGRTLSKE